MSSALESEGRKRNHDKGQASDDHGAQISVRRPCTRLRWMMDEMIYNPPCLPPFLFPFSFFPFPFAFLLFPTAAIMAICGYRAFFGQQCVHGVPWDDPYLSGCFTISRERRRDVTSYRGFSDVLGKGDRPLPPYAFLSPRE